MTLLVNHPQRSELRERLRQNIVLPRLKMKALDELEHMLAIADHRKGDVLLSQGAHDMDQYFVVDGILKSVVARARGQGMILRFARRTTWTRATRPGSCARPAAPTDPRRDQGESGEAAAGRSGRVPRCASRHPRRTSSTRSCSHERECEAHTITLHAARAPRGACTASCASTPTSTHRDRAFQEGARLLPQPLRRDLSRLKHAGKTYVRAPRG